MKGRRVRVVSEANDRADRCGQETNRLSRPQPVQPVQPVQPAQPGTSQPTRPGALISALPLLIVFFFVQKRFVEGIAMTGMK